MIIITGDSHGCLYNFKDLQIPNLKLEPGSLTMHRIGRDRELLHFRPEFNDEQNIFILCYGEIDNRCHIHRQVLTGRDPEEVVNTLVDEYFKTIAHVITKYKAIIVCSIVPPARQSDYEAVNGPIQHEFPFVGTDEERVSYCRMLNARIEKNCQAYGYFFLNYTDFYAREDGTLRFEISDKRVHIQETSHILECLYKILHTIFVGV